MAWDRTSLAFSLPMASWTNGNAPASFNIGNVPSLAGAWQNCVLTNMGGGFGFVNPGAGLGHLNFDGGADKVICDHYMSWANATLRTFEFKVDFVDNNDFQILAGDWNGAANKFMVLVEPTEEVSFYMSIGGVLRYSKSTEKLSNGKHTLHYLFDAGVLRMAIDGVEVTYARQNTYTFGNRTSTSKTCIGNDQRNAFAWNGKIFVPSIYEKVLSVPTMAAHHALGDDMGETANNVGDVLTIAGGAKIIVPAGIFEGSH